MLQEPFSQCSLIAVCARVEATPVMIDLTNYSATETLRDGRTVEIRAQRSQDRVGMHAAIRDEAWHRKDCDDPVARWDIVRIDRRRWTRVIADLALKDIMRQPLEQGLRDGTDAARRASEGNLPAGRHHRSGAITLSHSALNRPQLTRFICASKFACTTPNRLRVHA